MLIKLLLSPLNDVTTTYPNAPSFKTISSQRSGVDYTYQSDNFKVQKRLHPEIEPYKIDLSPADTFKRVEGLAAREAGWRIVSVDQVNMRLEAICTTTLLRYKDDVVIEVRPDMSATSASSTKLSASSSGNSTIHMRSKSRVGKSDLGANAKRIRLFFEKFK